MQISGVARIVKTTEGRTLLEVAGRPAFELNPVAFSIWTKLAEGQTLNEISSQIAREFSVPEETTTKDVARFVAKLKDHLLVYDS